MTGTETTKTFQTRFEDLMIESGKTLRDIANDTGISRAALNNYANDKAEIGINNVVKLAKYFNVSADYLLGLSDAKTNDKDLQTVCDYTGLSVDNIEILQDCARTYKNDNLPASFVEKTNAENAFYLKLVNDLLDADGVWRKIGEQLCRLTFVSKELNNVNNLLSNAGNKRELIESETYLLQIADIFQNLYEQYQIMMFNAEKIKKLYAKSISERLTNKSENATAIQKVRQSYNIVKQAVESLKSQQKSHYDILDIQICMIDIDNILNRMEADFFGNSNEAK